MEHYKAHQLIKSLGFNIDIKLITTRVIPIDSHTLLTHLPINILTEFLPNSASYHFSRKKGRQLYV